MEKVETSETGTNSSSVGLLGEYLKQKRIDKNYTLEKMSQKTKISVNILKSLESNDYEHLPSAAYIKGFVRSYVKVLGLPLEEAINKMEYTYLNVLGKPFPALNHTKLMSTQNQRTDTYHDDTSQSPHDVIESGDSIIQSTKSILPVVIFGAVILLFVGGYKMISSVVESEVNGQKTKDLGPKIESSSALLKDPHKAEEVKPTETTAAPSSTEPAATVTTPATDAPAVEAVKEEPEFQRNFPTVEFKKIRGKLFTVKTNAPENNDPAIIPEAIKDSMNANLQNVYIKAIDGNTWLSYKIDNNPIESVIINKGSDLFLQGNEMRIFLGNVNVTKIFYNNYLIDTPTKSGVKSLIFPEESNSKFQLPLFPKANDDILYTSEEYTKRMKLEEDELAKRREAN
ncbi:MAG: helix-turn-helix domain-containing protein [Bacteriovoracia bacterium]